MSEVKNRSLRLDDENYGWLSSLPGRTLNDALTEYRVGFVGEAEDGPLAEIRDQVKRLGFLVGELPDADSVAEIVRGVIEEFKSQKVTSSQIPSTLRETDPASVAGVTRGIPPPRRETGAERAARERQERQDRARALDKSGSDRDDIDRGDEYVSTVTAEKK